MVFLLDTNVLSELRKVKSGKCHQAVAAWANSVDAVDLYVSTMTIFEIDRGVLRLLKRDPDTAEIYRRWLVEAVLPGFAGRILPVDVEVARRCAALFAPNPRPLVDALIAATALAHGLIVVSRNVADFEPCSVATFDPWTFA